MAVEIRSGGPDDTAWKGGARSAGYEDRDALLEAALAADGEWVNAAKADLFPTQKNSSVSVRLAQQLGAKLLEVRERQGIVYVRLRDRA